ncbi:hypothetical protein [Phyllobacterium sophorae]|nr:hypothetical protein [Phyllobacterium sophorae]
MAKTSVHLDFKTAFKMEPDPKEALVFKIRPRKGISASDAVRTMRRITLAEQLVTTMSAGGRIKILAEGDSWVNLLWPESSALGYEMTFVNALAKDMAKYDTLNIGFPGDTFAEITKNPPQYKQPISGGQRQFFIFSGGGNDFLGGGSLVKYVKRFSQGGGSSNPRDYIKDNEFKAILNRLKIGYRQMVRNVDVWSSGYTHVLLQGYDYAHPRNNGPWLGKPFKALGYAWDSNIAKEIVKYSVDRFYEMLGGVADSSAKVHLVDARNCCQGNWHDELHPNEKASKKIAKKFDAAIDQILAVS